MERNKLFIWEDITDACIEGTTIDFQDVVFERSCCEGMKAYRKVRPLSEEEIASRERERQEREEEWEARKQEWDKTWREYKKWRVDHHLAPLGGSALLETGEYFNHDSDYNRFLRETGRTTEAELMFKPYSLIHLLTKNGAKP